MQGSNGSGNNDDPAENDTNNVIPLAGRTRRRDPDQKMQIKITMAAQGRDTGAAQPMINLPPLTKFLTMLLLGLHLGLSFLHPEQRYGVIEHFGFIPGYYSGVLPWTWSAFAGPLTFTFIHGGWVHLLMNLTMLMAFGSGLERWLGARRVLLLALGSNLFALGLYFILDPRGLDPVVGASGALSGFFAAAIIMMQERSGFLGYGKYRYLPVILVWVGIAVFFGMIGGPGGESIAWTAHIGGFLGGFLLCPLIRRLKI